MSLYNLRRVMWGVAAVAAVALGGAFLWRMTHPPGLPGPVVTGEAAIINAYTLTDHTGRTVTPDAYARRWQLVFFGFTYCPDICPTTLAYMASVMDLLGDDAGQVAPIFITVDPQRDTVDVMAAYVEAFHPRLIGLTGTERQVAEAAANFRVYYERAEDEAAPDGYLMAHSGYVYLMRPDGHFEAVFKEGDHLPGALADRISTLIEEDT